MPRIYAPIPGHTCDYGVDFVNGVAALESGADTSYFTRKGYDVDAGTHALTALDKVPMEILEELAEEASLHVSETITKRYLVLALNTYIENGAETDYTITYANGGGTGSAPTETDQYIGDVITLKDNTFTKSSHTFDGWTIGSKVYQPGDKYTIGADGADNVTITAKWKENA